MATNFSPTWPYNDRSFYDEDDDFKTRLPFGNLTIPSSLSRLSHNTMVDVYSNFKHHFAYWSEIRTCRKQVGNIYHRRNG